MANFLQMLPGFYFKLEEEHALPLACFALLSLLIPSTNGIWQILLRIGIAQIETPPAKVANLFIYPV